MSKAWKNLEYQTAKILNGKRLIRKSYNEKRPDVKMKDFPYLKIDTKRRKKIAILKIFESIQEKYCNNPKDRAILIMREHNSHTILAIMDIKLLAEFIEYQRKNNAKKNHKK